MTQAQQYERATQMLLNSIRATFGVGRWQCSQLRVAPPMQPALEAVAEVMRWQQITDQALGKLMTKLAANGAPLRRREQGSQAFWVLGPVVELKRPARASQAPASAAHAGAASPAAASCG